MINRLARRLSKRLCWFALSLLLLCAVSGNAQQLDYSAVPHSETAELRDEYNASDEDYISDDDYLSDDEEVFGTPNFTLESGQEIARSDRSKEFHAEIKKILASDDFAHIESVTRRRFIDILEQNEEQMQEDKFPEWIIGLARTIERFRDAVGGLAQLVEIMIWVLVIGIILFVIVRYRSQINNWASDIRTGELELELPTSLFGLDIQKDSIPDDVVPLAQSYWHSGDQRQAVATLLRSSLVKLLHEYGCRFFNSDTESECCDRIDQQAPASISAYMRILVSVWQRIAYAHMQPSKDEFDGLCRQWREVF
jgi:hypothetical protein